MDEFFGKVAIFALAVGCFVALFWGMGSYVLYRQEIHEINRVIDKCEETVPRGMVCIPEITARQVYKM